MHDSCKTIVNLWYEASNYILQGVTQLGGLHTSLLRGKKDVKYFVENSGHCHRWPRYKWTDQAENRGKPFKLSKSMTSSPLSSRWWQAVTLAKHNTVVWWHFLHGEVFTENSAQEC